MGADDSTEDASKRALANTVDLASGDAGESRPNGFAETIAQRSIREPDESGDMPTMVDRFIIEDELGAGGMGRVYVAYDPTLDRKVAVKLLIDQVGIDLERARARMAREARAMARLRHPNVVAVHEVGTYQGGVFIVMEFAPGGTLRDWLERDPERDWQRIVDMYTYAGRGLAAAHEAGLIHRDFKPDNVLVGEDGRVQVTDFGIANVHDDEPRERPSEQALRPQQARANSIIGTPPYMSPEQHEGKPVDASTDQFAFCAALYEALYGVRPFAGTTYDQIAEAAIAGQVTPPKRDRGVPARIHDAIMRGLQPDPEKRHPSIKELLVALAPRQPRSPVRWIAGAVFVLAAVIAMVVLRNTKDEPAVAPPVGVVAVESFEVALSSWSVGWAWREALGDVIAIQLGDIAGFKTVGPSNMLGPDGVRDARESPKRPDFRAAEIKAGASYVVHGAFEEREGKIRADARIVRPDGTEVGAIELERPLAELAMLLDDLTEAIARKIEPTARLDRINGRNRARALHGIGEVHLRNNDFEMARAPLEQAVVADPQLFDAWYSVLLVRSWVLAPESTVFAALESARATAPTEVRRTLIDGIGRYLRHDLSGARVVLEPLVENPSLSKAELRDALYFLGEAHWHDGHHREGVGHFRKALDLDFKFKLPIQHLNEYASANRDFAMMAQYNAMVASSARELGDNADMMKGNYAEIAKTGAQPRRLQAVILLGRKPTAEDEGTHAANADPDSWLYRAARAFEEGDAAKAKTQIDKIWKLVDERVKTGELADNTYYLLRMIGDIILSAGNVAEARRLVAFLAERSRERPVRSYQRLSILTAPLVGDKSLIERRELTERDRELADAIEAEMSGDREKAVALLDKLVKDPSPYWDYPERVALLRNLRALKREKEARALCDDTLRPAIFQWAVMPARRACRQR